MRKLLRASLCVGASLTFLVLNSGLQGADEGKPKHTIAEVMKEAHGKGRKSLLNQVKSGNATETQKKELLSLYEDMAKQKAPHGDQAHWEKLNHDLVHAARQTLEGKEGAIKELDKASNCAACHSAHRGKAPK